jgi:enolase
MKESKSCSPFAEKDAMLILNAVGKVKLKDYSEVASEISVALDLLLKEKFLFEKLLYKNKNQHRRAIYYHKMMEVYQIAFSSLTF